MRVTMDFECPICKKASPMAFIKPSKIGRSYLHHVCPCEAKFDVWITMKRGQSNQGSYDARLVNPEHLNNKERQFTERALSV